MRRFSRASTALYQPGLSRDTYPALAFRFLTALVPAECVVFGALNHRTGEMDMATDNRVPRFGEAMQAFGEVMNRYELFCWDPGVNAGRPFCRSDFFSRRQFRELDVYDRVYRLIGVDNHCAVHVPSCADETVFFGIERKAGPDFSAEERFILEIAQEQLGHARKLALQRDAEGTRPPDPALLTRNGLTPKEAEVAAWIAEGKSNEEIAVILGIGVYTVKGHVKRIFQKTGTPNRLATALWALRAERREQRDRTDLGLVSAQVLPRLQRPFA